MLKPKIQYTENLNIIYHNFEENYWEMLVLKSMLMAALTYAAWRDGASTEAS